ncbi:MAG: hypothetical protein WEB88_13190 [Gemmatimonadota bacterium]
MRTPGRGGQVPGRSARAPVSWTLAVALAAGLVASAPAAAPVAAQGADERTLHWDEIRVAAHLDADGTLRVREYQEPVFWGDWNGGERTFRVRFGQTLRVNAMARLDPVTGDTLPMRRGSLDRVHEWAMLDGNTLRWRVRAPSDPPLQAELRPYEIQYTLAHAVLVREDGFLLDHDFLFADRAGTVRRFALELSLDPAWVPATALPPRYDAADLWPGRGFAVTVPLRYAAAGWPAAVPRPLGTLPRAALLLVLLGGAGLLCRGFYRREARAGRYAPLTPPRQIDHAWLGEHVLHLPAEVVGAAWDRSTAAPEVAGMLARLVVEGRLASRVEPGKDDDPVLHLELLVDRDAFTAEERALIDALFFEERQVTDTKTIKEHYKSKGFDPAAKIRTGLKLRLRALPGAGSVGREWMVPVLVLGVSAGLMVLAGMQRPASLVVGLVIGFAVLGPALIAAGTAAWYAARVVGLRGGLVGLAIPLLAVVVLTAVVVSGTQETSGGILPYFRSPLALLLGLIGWALGWVMLVLAVARPTDTPERLAFRRRLAAARAFFQAELEKPDPALEDAWYPYLLAFGLEDEVDGWFSAFGGTAAGVTATTGTGAATTAMTAGSASSGGGWSGGGQLFGGGGGFAGGGVSRTWGSAAAGIATGVSSPSSGGGGGGASSGGGGGGGW